jgi:hypothetical protein
MDGLHDSDEEFKVEVVKSSCENLEFFFVKSGHDMHDGEQQQRKPKTTGAEKRKTEKLYEDMPNVTDFSEHKV